MSIGDILSNVGHGLATGARVAGAVAGPVIQSLAEEESGQAPEIQAERRRQKMALQQASLASDVNELQSQLDLGIKYGTLNDDQQNAYRKAIAQRNMDAITQAGAPAGGNIAQRLHAAFHPGGAPYQPPTPALPNAVPEGGTNQAANDAAIRLAEARYTAMRKNNPKLVSLDSYANDNFGTDFTSATPEQQEAALEAYGKANRAPKMVTRVVNDSDSLTGYSAATWDVDKKSLVSKFPGVLPPRGFVPTERISKSKDQFGNVIETIGQTTPLVPGATSAAPNPNASGTPTAAPSQPASSTAPRRSFVGLALGGGATGARPSSPSPTSTKALSPTAAPVLDDNGHIPAHPGVNEQVRELANELLDGRDAKDLPMKGKAPAQALARQYGWEQGAFTPKEKILINEAGAKLQQLRDSPSLSVLNNTGSRMRIAQVLDSAEKQGFVGRTASALAAGSLSPQEQEFVRNYNAAVGVISGLTPLTRGGRQSESSIHRLMQEMPSVLQSSNAEDAQKRVDQLLQEVKVATSTTGATPVGATVGSGAAAGGIQIDRDANGRIVGVR